MPYNELHSTEYQIFQIEITDEIYFSRLSELRKNNIELLKKLYAIGSRLKFVDHLRFHINQNWREEMRHGHGVSERSFQYDLDRTKTYLTLTCIDVAAGRSYKRFYEWLLNELRSRNDEDTSFINNGLTEILELSSLEGLSSHLIKWINNELLKRYISDYGVRCKFLSFIKESPIWLKDWLLSSYYIYNGELNNDNKSEFYWMQPEKKLDLIANYFFYLRNKFTHTIDYIEPHEDEQTRFFQPSYDIGRERSILFRTIHEDGDRTKPIRWSIGVLSNLNESDIVRTVLILQTRHNLLSIGDDASVLATCLHRNEYRNLGYSFLKEVGENLKSIQTWQYFNHEEFRYKFGESVINPLSLKYAISFLKLHNSIYPHLINHLYPNLFEQQNKIYQNKYPSMRKVERVDLSEYVKLVELFDSELNSIRSGSVSNGKDRTLQLMYSHNTRQLCAYIECIQMELSYRLDEVIY